MGKWLYRSTFSWPRHKLEVSGQLHAPAALPPGKDPPVPLDRTLDEAQNWSGRRGEEEVLDPTGTRTPTSPSSSRLYVLLLLLFLIFADDLKISRVIKSAEDCKILQSDTDPVQKSWSENYMRIIVFKTNIISFTRKTNNIHFNYFMDDLLIVRTNHVKIFGLY
jgi:hypothetical protein